ncbi:1-hydroxycarotenoid 3,4-desaturase CrtD [Sulfitobacter guttiformis]|uniref:1-hydroxycarotenoid 3,4-desaturase n=1 Tax=Sulfitobacter guttiformis TaxID=74349 RepID=J7G2T7_9RHOB|nr:1-hydroxycarotenoid 3,4-desaturase CrtD [Sulfitobacter guttiformis]AFP55504.1 methoxyneurosporene dehydrogenase [Sulfitobacter guttiformis]KIN75479.1 Methoxyneurosporene dehydrogenase [Sulfitobacter guttiformis KCTC 32187]RKE92127.1 1-hydroxycarotenoid 3,4-desaturase [Sulfitobacter guttiformis]
MSITALESNIPENTPHIAVIGAGIGGLAAALRLIHTGAKVTVFERHAKPGGKMRTLPSDAGPVDAGPTVLTLKHVFDDLFADVGARLEDHVTLTAEPLLARHFWRDGTTLDLMADPVHSRQNVADIFGTQAARDFTQFGKRAAALFDTFDAPMMQSPTPDLSAMTRTVLRKPAIIPAMAPHNSLAKMLRNNFSEPKLVQLFSRYATYVGGLPDDCPAILSLIWEAERRGVWHVEGGMHRLAVAIEALARKKGAQFRYNDHVSWIETDEGRPCAVHTESGRTPVNAVLFNGDPRALNMGMLGPDLETVVPPLAIEPRSLSAQVQAFAATVENAFPLAAHNVFFADDGAEEYTPLARDALQSDPTLYVCAQDRFGSATPDGPERFEIILNAPPVRDHSTISSQESDQCQNLIFNRLAAFGLTFSPPPMVSTLTGPHSFAALFPGSNGSLYGRSPAGMMAAFARPTARTKMAGLYLTGGGAHPGAGVPMATLSAAHAAAAMSADLCLTSTSPQAATLGGTSTA